MKSSASTTTVRAPLTLLDDNESTHSTIPVDQEMLSSSCCQKRSLQQQESSCYSRTTSCKKRRRRRTTTKIVQFDDDAMIVHESHHQEPLCDDKNSLWYQAADYRTFKSQVKKLCKDIIIQEIQDPQLRACRLAVQDLFASWKQDEDDNEDDEVQDVFISASSSSEDNDEEIASLLDHWTLSIEERHGLESASNRQLSKWKADRSVQLMDTLLNVQRECAKYYDHRHHPHADPHEEEQQQQQQLLLLVSQQDVRDEILREVCQTLSRPSRILAQKLAESHAKAISRCS